MTPEERFERIEQKIEFIVNQQAQSSVELAKQREEFTADMQRLEQNMSKLTDATLTVALAQVRTEERFAKLAEAQAKQAEGLWKLEEKAAETEERLNVFITFVERYMSSQQNGHPPNA